MVRAGSIIAAVCLLPLAGCFSHSSSEAVTPLTSELQTGGFVSDIHITSMPPDTDPSLAAKLQASLAQAMKGCATGTHPLRLEVAVTRFKGQNAAMTLLIGSSNVIEGTAKLVEPSSQAVVGDYDIAHSTGGGGVIAAVGMSGAEQKMADAFAGDVCKKAFGRSAS